MSNQHFFELRIYRIFDFEKQQQIERYLESALVPALNRQEIQPVGVFSRLDDENDHSAYVLIPYETMDQFTALNSRLASDGEYINAAAEHFDRDLKDPSFVRIESRLMKAFSGMPSIELPAQTEKGENRIFELRLYESHTEHHAALKVEMFNDGEIQIMKDVEMAPVFFGETLIASDVPNLIYMLSADNDENHKAHWKAFLQHPDWKRMSKMEKYKDTVSKINKWFLRPSSCSQI